MLLTCQSGADACDRVLQSLLHFKPVLHRQLHMNDTEARALDKQQYATAFYYRLSTVEAGNRKCSTPRSFILAPLFISLFKITLTLHNE